MKQSTYEGDSVGFSPPVRIFDPRVEIQSFNQSLGLAKPVYLLSDPVDDLV